MRHAIVTPPREVRAVALRLCCGLTVCLLKDCRWHRFARQAIREIDKRVPA